MPNDVVMADLIRHLYAMAICVEKRIRGYMKAKLLALVSLASLFVMNGCNGIGDKDTLLARIGDEKVYQEDFRLLVKNSGKPDGDKGKYLYDNLYSRVALASRALSEFPDLKQDWQTAFKDLDPRILTMVYQRFFVMECLMYGDGELRKYYDANKSLFVSDTVSDYYDVRNHVAEYYYISKNQEKWNAFLSENIKSSEPSAADTVVARNRFVEEYRQHLRDSLSNEFKNSKRVDVHEVPPVYAKNFYERHKDQFMTVPGYVLYHVQSSDSAALANAFKEQPTLDQFKQKALSFSQNKLTAKDGGYIGFVKQDYALPYGIGVVPQLSAALEGKQVGFVTDVLKAERDSVYHRFYLSSLVPSKLKPFDRVEAGINARIQSGSVFEVDSSFVLITKDGKPLFTEEDLLRFNAEYSKQHLSKTVHDRLVSMWAEVFSFAELATEAHLNHSWEYRAIVRDTRLDYILKYYPTKLHEQAVTISEDSLRALYGGLAVDKLKGIAFFPQNLYKFEYYNGYRLLSFGKSLEQIVPEVYTRMHLEYSKKLMARKSAEAYAAKTVHLYDTSVPEYKPDMLSENLLAKADSLFKAGKFSEAYEKYRDLQLAYADVDSLFEKATYEMAVIQNENGEFKAAEAIYYAYYMMWPESPNAEKAMFSRGFILNENLSMNTRAQVVLEEFLQKYPNSELKESAQWLVDNIKSDGKLAEDLMKKIEAEE